MGICPDDLDGLGHRARMQAQRLDHFLLLAAEIALEVAAHTLDVECLQLLGAGAQVQRFNGTEFEEHV
jgi:hypothetical protein